MTIKVLAKANRAAEVLVYEQIGADWYGNGVTAKKFREELAALGEVDEITVRINSPGGEVFDGFTIYNELRAHKARKIVHIDGLAASIASVICFGACCGRSSSPRRHALCWRKMVMVWVGVIRQSPRSRASHRRPREDAQARAARGM